MDIAWLLLMLLEETINVPGLEMPPPATAELPLTVQLVSVVVPVYSVPSRRRWPAELPLTVQLVSVALSP